MTSRRIERLNQQLRRELMQLLQLEIRDPRVSGVTVTHVETTTDLYHARVLITTLATEEERATIMEGLAAAHPFLRGEISRRLRIRKAPELHFEWDRTLDHARRIDELLAQVRPPAEPETDEMDGDD